MGAPMAKVVNKLTDATVRNAAARAKRYKLYDGGGLYVEVYPEGGRYWRLKYRMGGKERRLSLGTYPEVKIAEAREKAAEARKVIKAGRDPATEQRASQARAAANAATTFQVVALEWMARKDWSESYRTNIEHTFKANLFQRIGSVPIGDIDAPLLLEALRPMEARNALDVLSRARRWCSEIMRYAIATGRRRDDPAAALKGAFKTRTSTNHPALARAEIGPFLRKLTEYPGRLETRIAARLLLLTAVRTGELRPAEWTEFDLDAKEWRIPKERMKMRAPHIVPLATQAVTLLEQLRVLTGYSRYLFPNHGKHPFMSENTINSALRSMGYGGRVVGHGFRATFSTIVNESGHFNPDAIERQLAHSPRDKIRAAYHRAEYLPERRRMMQWWADFLDAAQKGAEVVTLKHGA